MPHPRVWPRVHPAVQPAAAPQEPRVADREAQEQTLPLQHLWQRVRHRKQSQDAHGQGESLFIVGQRVYGLFKRLKLQIKFSEQWPIVCAFCK